MSVSFYGRAFAVFDAALFGAFFAECCNAEVPNLVVDLAKGGFGKLMRRLHRFLELRDAGERAISLFARQRFQNLANVLDLRNAMAHDYQVISRVDRQANRLLETVSVQDSAHVEIVGHDEAVESEFFA